MSFIYKNNLLYADNIKISDIEKKVPTPFYLYSATAIVQQFKRFSAALSGLDYQIFYAVKANSNIAVLKLLANLGAGMDVVSAGEFLRARAAGVASNKIVFSGVGKTRFEMELALKSGVYQFNVESEPELHRLDQVAQALGLRAPVAIRINPDVDARTHAKISTGKSENKFGIPLPHAPRVFAIAASLAGINLCGIDMHIGSQITEDAPYCAAYGKLALLVQHLRADGHNIRRLDLGGGLGIRYSSNIYRQFTLEKYGQILRQNFSNLGCQIDVEPGRLLVGNAGLLIASVIYNKVGINRNFLILDAGMNDFMRPALYDSYHEIIPVIKDNNALLLPVDIVGPVCESSDTFALQRLMPLLQTGALVAFQSAGAYGAVMASEYNTRALTAEVMVQGDRLEIIRAPVSFDDIIKRDNVPSWL